MKRPTLKTPILVVMILGAAGLGVACHLAILGGRTQETTETPCPDGTWCPNAYPLCPQYPGERCQTDDPDIETGGAIGAARAGDAGDDAGPRLHRVHRPGPFPVRHADKDAAPSPR